MRMTEQEYSDLINRKQTPLKQTAVIPLEDQEQQALVVWLRQRGIRHHATPNGGKRHVVTAKKLAGQGVVAGVPDITIWPAVNTGCPVLWIEIKRTKGGTVSAEQQAWIDYLNEIGRSHNIKAAVCQGFQAARDFILTCGY